MAKPLVGYAGMTHLGLNSAAAAAGRGFRVVCFDPDTDLIQRLKAHDLPVSEPGLRDVLLDHVNDIEFTSHAETLAACDLLYVAPDIPTDAEGQSDLSRLRNLIGIVDDVMRPDAPMVVLSQAPPGFTRALARAEKVRFYQVETLVFGRAIERAMYPERFIVGCANPQEPLPSALVSFLQAFQCPILPMRYESAELCKISINMFLVASVTTTNTLAEICERTGANWSEIAPALRLDQRIGPHAYLAPGLGISGGNLERDLATIVQLGDRHGTDVGLVRAFQRNSAHRKDWALRTLMTAFPRGIPARVGVLGLAYKENTASVKNSPAVQLIRDSRSCRIGAFDPLVNADTLGFAHVSRAASAEEACTGTDAIAIMTPWAEFGELEPARIAALMRGDAVLDPYRILDVEKCRNAGLRHFYLGFGE